MAIKVCTQAMLARLYLGFLGIKQLAVLLPPPPPPPIGCQSIPRLPPKHFIRQPWHIASTHLYFWVEGSTVRKKCFSQEHNTLTQPGLAPRLFDPKSSHSTIGQLHLPVGRKNCLFDEKCQFENFWFFTLPIPPFYQYLVQIPDLVVQI